jgi:hypothetical protein
MGLPIGHVIRHVRYEEFVALISEGAGDLDGFHAAVDALLAQMGDVGASHVLVDLIHKPADAFWSAGRA